MITIPVGIQAFLEHRASRRRSEQTLHQYGYQLNELWLSWRIRQDKPEYIQLIQVDEFIEYFRYLENEHVNKRTQKIGLEPATRDSAWRVLRTFWNYLGRRKWITQDQRDYFIDDEIIARPSVPEQIRPVMEDSILQAMLEACNSFGVEERALTRAILLMLSETGARVSEVSGLNDESINFQKRSAKIIGKGGRQERLFWHGKTDRALQTYLRVRLGESGGPLFRRLMSGERMLPDDIRRCVKQVAQHAGVELPKGAPIHSFRHRFAHKCLDGGLDISQVGQLMRHRASGTTLIYLRENEERLRKIRDRVGEGQL